MARVRQPIVNKKVPVAKGKVSGFLSFGPDNLFPQTLIDVIDDSDTASAAMNVRAEFIEGNGLRDLDLSRMVVNRKGQTLDDIHAATSWNVAVGEVVVLHVGYNALAQIVSVQVIPWEQIRFPEPDDLGNIIHAGIFQFLGSTLYAKRQNEHKKVYMFDPRPDVVFAQIESEGGIERYHGQILYMPAGRLNGSIYHVPTYAGGSIAFETEKELSTYDYRVTTSDFAVSGFIKALRPKRGSKDTQNDGDSIANRVTQHQGSENAGSMFVIEADTTDELEAIDFVPTTGAQLADRYNALADRVINRIARRTRVPKELMSVKQDGISFTQIQLKLSSQLMQQTVNRYQRTIERAYQMIFAHWHVPLGERDYSTENLNYFPEDTPANADGTVAQPG